MVRHSVTSQHPHHVLVAAEEGRFVHGEIHQGETDFTIRVVAPDEREVGIYDSRERGVELVSFIAGSRGPFRLEVRTVQTSAGTRSFGVRFDEARPSQAGDERLVEAERLATMARSLYKAGGRDALRQAVTMQGALVPEWQALGRPEMVGAALSARADAMVRLNDYAPAERAYREALDLARGGTDRRSIAELLNNIGLTQRAQADLRGARQSYEEALAFWRILPPDAGRALTHSNLGVVLRQTGEYEAARIQYSHALAIATRLRDRPSQALALSNLGIVQDALGQPRTAIRTLQQAVRLFDLKHPVSSARAGRALLAIARTRFELGERVRARDNVNRGLALIQPTPDRLAQADGLALSARMFDESGDRERAEAEYREAMRLFGEVGSRRGESDVFHARGVASLNAGATERAVELLTQALTIRREAGLRGLEAETLVQIARAEQTAGHLERARTRLETALTIVEQIRGDVFERELRQSYVDSLQQYYQRYVAVLVGLHRAQPEAGFEALAFEAAERSRSLGLAERLRALRTALPVDVDRTLVERERELRRQINFWSLQSWQRADNVTAVGTASDIAATLERLLSERNQVEAEILRATARSGRPTPSAEGLMAVVQREAVDADTVLIDYHFGEPQSFAWAVTSTAATVIDLPAWHEVDGPARRFLALVSTPATPATAERRARESETLSRLLLDPLRPWLTRRRLLIIPDRLQIPFAALRTPGSSAPLSADHDLLFAPSATLLVHLRRTAAERAAAPRRLAVIGDPVYSVADSRFTTPPASTRVPPPAGRELTRLPFAADEMAGVTGARPTPRDLGAPGFAATRGLLVGPTPALFSNIHLAVHAVDDRANPELSGIILSLIDEHGRAVDGFLRLQDIYTLRWNAELVVLSACRTAVGPHRADQGAISLAGGFFHAGSIRVLASLWEVNDEATAALMTAFYQSLLRDRQPPASALRLAQHAVRREQRWRDPYYWSGFVLQGTW